MTADGLRLDGALQIPAEGSATEPSQARFDAVVALHGVGGNFYTSSLFENLTPTLLKLGVAVVSANTRGHDTLFAASAGLRGRCWLGGAVEKVDDCRLDVAAWLKFLADRGYRRLGVVGHSLGAIKAVYSQACEPDARVTGVLGLSPPRLSYAAFQYDPRAGAFQEAVSAARLAVRDGRGQQLLQVNFPYTQWMAPENYLDKYGPDEKYNVIPLIGRLNCPVCIAYGQRELEDGSMAFAGVPDALRQAQRPDQDLTLLTIPNADHNYSGAVPALACALGPWLVGSA